MEPKENKENRDNKICRALITPNSTDSNDYDFEAVAVPSENGQINYSWQNDEYFNQILRTNKENINTDRLDSGLPLFDNHPWDKSALNTLGISTSYIIDDRGIVLRCKLGARADEALRNDIKNGVIKTVSIEGTIDNYTIVREIGKLPQYYADLWTPESLSFAPVPNDIGSQIEVKRKIQTQIESNTSKSQFYKLKSKF